MKSRCYCKGDSSYKYYGARGVQVCDSWLNSFDVFKVWAYESGYSECLTIDRIDIDGHYCPSNCRWVTQLEQNRNKRNTLYITFQGLTKSAPEWAETLGVKVDVIHRRYHRNGTPYTNKELEVLNASN